MSEPGRAWLLVKEGSAVAEARRQAKALAQAIGLPDEAGERAAIAVSEAATNVLKYAGGGRILITERQEAAHPTLVLIAADEGPGIDNVDRALADGFSTAGSQGIGLGAISRQTNTFDIVTKPGEGTILVAEVCMAASPSVPLIQPPLSVASLMLNYPGERVCGDGCAIRRGADTTDLLVCDGLGHGAEAHRATLAALAAFEASAEASPGRLLEELSEAAAATRGLVALVCSVDHDEPKMTFAGIGNVSGVVASPRSVKRLASKDGRLGAQTVSTREEAMAFGDGEVLVMHSDGIKTLRDFGSQTGLMFREPLSIAGFILARALRGNDDACVLVAKRQRTAGSAQGPTP